MPRSCTICSHPRVAEIDDALLERVTFRRVAQRFEASESSVYRHAREHLPIGSPAFRQKSDGTNGTTPEATVAASALESAVQPPGGKVERGVALRNQMRSEDLIGYMVRVQQRTLGILERASEAGRHETALKAIRETRGNIALISKLEGLLGDGGNRSNTIDLCRLSSEQLGLLLKASLGELSARDRQKLMLEIPDLSELGTETSW